MFFSLSGLTISKTKQSCRTNIKIFLSHNIAKLSVSMLDGRLIEVMTIGEPWGMAKRWLQSGCRLTEAWLTTLFYNKLLFWHFDYWPFNRGWPRKWGSTTLQMSTCIYTTCFLNELLKRNEHINHLCCHHHLLPQLIPAWYCDTLCCQWLR